MGSIVIIDRLPDDICQVQRYFRSETNDADRSSCIYGILYCMRNITKYATTVSYLPSSVTALTRPGLYFEPFKVSEGLGYTLW